MQILLQRLNVLVMPTSNVRVLDTQQKAAACPVRNQEIEQGSPHIT
jgi:hypothetical protein